MKNKKLYLLCGIPASGKSTWAKEKTDAITVSRDEIRFNLLKLYNETPEADYFGVEDKVFDIFTDIIQSHLAKGENVIADATHINRRSRNKLLSNLTIPNDYTVEAVVFDTPLEVCKERNGNRFQPRRVPEDALESMFEAFSKPRKSEFQNHGLAGRCKITEVKYND